MTSLNYSQFFNIIDGRSKTTQQVRHGINPANKEQLWPAPVSSREDVDDAVDAARRAAPAWAETSWEDRRKRVCQLADALEGSAGEFAKLLVLEQGKPISVARHEVGQAVIMLRGSAKNSLPDQIVEETAEHRVLTRYIPVGVCVGIVPWNLNFKLGPALMAGNPMIIKPSPFTPYTGLKFIELAQGFFPPGVVQALAGGDELGPWLTEHPGVDKVSFTGSTPTGIRVLQSCSKTLKRVTLELGGNDPAIVHPEVDIQATAANIGTLALYNSGQVCIAIKRVYVHSSIYDEFAQALAKFVQSMTVGDGMNETTQIGPVQNEMQYGKLKSLVAAIKRDGLKTLTGDLDNCFANDKGYFMSPVVIDNPPDDSEIVTEEPFGPIFPLLKWDNEEDVIRRANDSTNALGASIWSKDRVAASRMARRLQAGTVWINKHMELRPDAAFGGLKQSGMGCELGAEGLKAYCNVQTINADVL
ncbi:4-trimethylaminobutyraldehyde dehydrogenase [Sarocladium strictum]